MIRPLRNTKGYGGMISVNVHGYVRFWTTVLEYESLKASPKFISSALGSVYEKGSSHIFAKCVLQKGTMKSSEMSLSSQYSVSILT